MLKLIKYEFRKKLPAIVTFLGIVAAMEIYFLVSYFNGEGGHMTVAAFLLIMASFAMSIAVFVMGINSYSGELKHKSSYLIFMTPNSTLKIIASKMLFTLLLGILFAGAIALTVWLDVPIYFRHFNTLEGYYNVFEVVMTDSGVDLQNIYGVMAITISNIALEIMSFVGIAYLAVTLSATVLQNKKGKGVVSLVLFLGISYGLSKLSGLYFRDGYVVEDFKDIIRMMVPSVIQSAVVILISTFGSAWMLEKRVSL